MSSNPEELIGLLKCFDGDLESTGQGWADVGASLAEGVVKKFTKNDWHELLKRQENLTNGQMHLMALLIDLAPDEFSIKIAQNLIKHATGEPWIEALNTISHLYILNARLFPPPSESQAELNKFKSEVTKYINLSNPEDLDFHSYLMKHSHLIELDWLSYYKYLYSGT
ncbi:hypothetical protein IB234_21770 [Pseudomonas sp. PDM16]|uniref:hypothetical protein n=1 Tax=Pseudomonas sp. PDM16 TaxID=2769292 RepID=UPI00177ED6C1|nr:hypothetical protein [Pseudomonas sp. PDM16]MBD9417203.1 hypothetical protein [Pseudomonas sp. PDM16]